ncbi:MAG TPA: hypothetical protein VNB06_21055 [Thermoanaerobaculia bacterium]|nr:hypothetical protein [Thermoanaerobaculia bacterium]
MEQKPNRPVDPNARFAAVLFADHNRIEPERRALLLAIEVLRCELEDDDRMANTTDDDNDEEEE